MPVYLTRNNVLQVQTRRNMFGTILLVLVELELSYQWRVQEAAVAPGPGPSSLGLITLASADLRT